MKHFQIERMNIYHWEQPQDTKIYFDSTVHQWAVEAMDSSRKAVGDLIYMAVARYNGELYAP